MTELKERIKKILKENVKYLSDGDSIDDDSERDKIAEKIMQLMINEFY